MSLFLYLVCAVWVLAGLVASQTTHVVNVGADGSFYNPATISAQINDTVRFVFSGPAHSVTQTSFDSPCVPLKGGFNSGITGIGTNVSASPPTWDIIVSNVSQPIWFFCESTTPRSHCASGMVGVINPISIQQYDDFVSAAKLVTGTASPTPSLTLSGVGAFATNSPAPSSTPPVTSTELSTSTSSFATSSTSPVPSDTPTPTPVPQSYFESHKGGIVAGIVIACIAGIILLMLVYFWLKRQRDQATIRDFFNYEMPSPSLGATKAFPSMINRTTSQLALPSTSIARTGNNNTNTVSVVTPIVPQPPQEYDFSSGFGRTGHAYANIGLSSKEDSELSTSDTYSGDIYTSTSTWNEPEQQGRVEGFGRSGRHQQKMESLAAALQHDQKHPDGPTGGSRDSSPAPPMYRT